MDFIFNGTFNPQDDVQLSSSNVEDYYDFSLILSTDVNNSYVIHSSAECVNQQELSIFQNKMNNNENCSFSFLNEVIFIIKFEMNQKFLIVRNNMRFCMASELKLIIDDNEYHRIKLMFQQIKDYVCMIYERNFNE